MPTKKKSEPTAAADVAPDAQPAAAPLNREQRRRQKFGNAGKVHQHDAGAPWPENAPNPALTSTGGEQAAHAGRPDQGITRQTGPGSGGATETAERTPEHEGIHGGNSTKG
jgi:hypothetical protein